MRHSRDQALFSKKLLPGRLRRGCVGPGGELRERSVFRRGIDAGGDPLFGDMAKRFTIAFGTQARGPANIKRNRAGWLGFLPPSQMQQIQYSFGQFVAGVERNRVRCRAKIIKGRTEGAMGK